MASDELRALLRSTDFESQSSTPARSNPSKVAGSVGIGQTPLKDLASLLGTLDIDIGTPWTKNRPMGAAPENSNKNQPDSTSVHDDHDATVIHFGIECSLRGRLGKYITAVPLTSPSLESTTDQSKLSPFGVGVDGQGVGDPLDSLIFVSAENRDEVGPLKYGMTVCIKAPAARDRLLGVRESKLGYWRGLMGQGEKWTILKGSPGGRTTEDHMARGLFVRQGEYILLQAGTIPPSSSSNVADHLLSLHEGVTGCEPRLVHKDRASLGAELWQVDLHGAQPLPLWSDRPYLSGKFLVIPSDKRSGGIDAFNRAFPGDATHHSLPPIPPLSTLSATLQQQILVREVLLALTGVEGDYIRIAGSSDTHGLAAPKLKDVKLVIDVTAADKAAALQVATLLPICEHAIKIREFTRLHSRLSHGLVSHALAAAIKAVMREFDLLTAQLESLLKSASLSLQRIVFLLQPARATLQQLNSLVTRLWDLSGGELLDSLHLFSMDQGDAKSKNLCIELLQKSCKPFLHMLSRWIFCGELEDAYKEFMVHEDLSISQAALAEDFNAQYWESRYTLRETHIPRLFRGIASRSLTAGKYLNVIKGCLESGLDGGISLEALQLPQERALDLDSEGSAIALSAVVEEAYVYSSRALLRLLCDGHGLYTHLRSLSRFFLLEHGDFFIQFMDTAEEELRREAKDVALPRIQGLLQLAVQTSTLALDPHREDLSCALATHNLIQHLHLIQSAGMGGDSGERAREAASYSSLSSQGLKGVEALTLEYKVGWPVSLVLSRRAITKYQLLSRLLYFSKHVELRVLGSWQDHQNTKELNVRQAMGAAFCLRHRMLHFLQNFVYYMALEVIGPRGHEMKEGMQTAADMDEVLGLHERYLDTCLKECLLASQDLLKNLTKIMTTCLLFADQMRRFSESSVIVGDGNRAEKPTTAKQRRERLNTQTNYVRQETAHDSFQRMLAKFADTFDSQLKEFLERLWTDSYRHHPQLANLCTRLDYNQFYSTAFST